MADHAFGRSRHGPKHLARQLDEANTLLAWFHHLRNQARRDPVDLAKAVVCLEFVADDHRRVPPELEAVVGRFADPEEQARVGAELLTASLSNPEEALLDAGIQLMTPVATGKPDRLSSLCLAYRRRHERTGSTTDLEHAIETGEQVVALAPGAETWARLAEAYQRRYALSADLEALRQVVDLLDHVVRVDPGALSKLGAVYRLLYDQTGDVEALDKAVTYGEQGAEPAELSVTLLRRFERNGSLPDLLRAAELADIGSTADVNSVADIAAVLLTKHEYGGDRRTSTTRSVSASRRWTRSATTTRAGRTSCGPSPWHCIAAI